jgi:hypothetical protein
MKKKKDFFEELRDRKIFREIKAYLFGGATMIPLIYYANMAKETAREWGIDYLP